jgi:hypothetical protein
MTYEVKPETRQPRTSHAGFRLAGVVVMTTAEHPLRVIGVAATGAILSRIESRAQAAKSNVLQLGNHN